MTQEQPKRLLGKTSGSQTSSANSVDENMAGMRHLVDQSLIEITDQVDALSDEYARKAQPLVDDISQRIFDMASNSLIYEAVADNVSYLLEAEVTTVDRPRLGKQTLKPLSFSRLGGESLNKPQMPALKQASETSNS